MKRVSVAGLACCLAVPALAQQFVPLPPDRPMQVGTLQAVCTGVGLEARENPAWASYPLRIEIAGRGGQYLGDVRVTLSQDAKVLAAVSCDGPWLLFKTAPGRYRVEAETESKKVASDANALAQGQGRVILRFPELGGEIPPPPPKP